MIFGGLKNTGVKNMNSNVRPTIFIKKILTNTLCSSKNEYVIQTPNGFVKDSNGERIVFRGHQLDKAGAMVKAIRKSTGQF